MIALKPWQALALGLAGALVVTLVGCPMPANQVPTANAGADQTVTGGSAVTLNGSGSSDPRGRTLSYQWQQTGGSPTVTLTDANSAIATFAAPNQATTLTFQLTVNNNAGGTASDTTLVTVTAPAPPNQSPVANAGPDQTVTAGATVNLNGGGSSDPDGDPLTFQWQQTAGTPTVTLNNANTAAASFTAPNQAATLTFQLTVSDGNGGTASDTAVVTVMTGMVAKPILYIANFNGANITAYDITSPETVNGNIPPNANLAGGQTLLAAPADLVVNKDGALLVANNKSVPRSVTGYASALDLGSINGNIAPTQNLQGGATGLTSPVSLAINAANDLLFVAEANGGTVFVYANASSVNGNTAPTRTISSGDMNKPRGINFGANDELYVANIGNNSVSVFANASNLNGTVNASRVITSTAFGGLFDVFIDSNDRMYVVNSDMGAANKNRINIFANAAARNGPVMPDVTLIVPAAGNLTAIAVDSAGNGYIVDAGANAVYGYDNIATRNGTIAPDRTLQGANTLLVAPIRVFLHE